MLDAFYEAGCDDALIGIRDGIAYADFCREADSFPQALLSAMQDVQTAGAGSSMSSRMNWSPCPKSPDDWT